MTISANSKMGFQLSLDNTRLYDVHHIRNASVLPWVHNKNGDKT